MRTQRGVLPDDHPQRTSALLDRAVACVEGGNRHGALDVLRPMMDEDAEVGGGAMKECASVLPGNASFLLCYHCMHACRHSTRYRHPHTKKGC